MSIDLYFSLLRNLADHRGGMLRVLVHEVKSEQDFVRSVSTDDALPGWVG